MTVNTVAKPDFSLDITGDVCPITFVKTKLLLEAMPAGAAADIRLRAGEPLDNVPRTLAEYGHDILDIEEVGDDVFLLRVRKAG